MKNNITTSWKTVQRQFRATLKSLLPTRYIGWTGWADGTVVNASYPNFIRVTLPNKEEVEAWNDGIPSVAGMQVDLYTDPDYPGLLRARQPTLSFAKNFPYVCINFHKDNHTWPGPDTVAVELRQFMPLHPSVNGFVLTVRAGWVESTDGLKFFASESVDLSSYKPASGARYVLVSIGDDGLLTITSGTVKDLYSLVIGDIPERPLGHKRICAVRLHIGQAYIKDEKQNPDLLDLRFISSFDGDMFKATYDQDADGIVDSAEKVDGVDAAGNNKYYGTDESGVPGFYDLPEGGGWGAGGASYDYILLVDEKTSGTAGGSSTANTWKTRDINTEKFDEGLNCSISSNQFTLSAGKYYIQALVPHYHVGQARARLRNITDSIDVLYSQSDYVDNGSPGTQLNCVILGSFEISAPTVFEIQSYVSDTGSTNRLGVPTSISGVPEIYTVVELWKKKTASDPTPHILLREQATGFVDNIGMTSGDWRTRPVNAEVVDTDNLCALSSYQFTLQPGTYDYDIESPAYYVDGHQARLYNITDSSIVDVGTSERAGREASTMTTSKISGRFTITSAKTFELQHRCQTTNSSNGMGEGVSWADTQVWAILKFWKVS